MIEIAIIKYQIIKELYNIHQNLKIGGKGMLLLLDLRLTPLRSEEEFGNGCSKTH